MDRRVHPRDMSLNARLCRDRELLFVTLTAPQSGAWSARGKGLAFLQKFGPNSRFEATTYAENRMNIGQNSLEEKLRRPILYPLSYSRTVPHVPLQVVIATLLFPVKSHQP